VVNSCRMRIQDRVEYPSCFVFFTPTGAGLWIVSVASWHPPGIHGPVEAVLPLIKSFSSSVTHPLLWGVVSDS
jgi:hypothetical protein